MPIEINGRLYMYAIEIAEHFGVDRNSVTQRIQRGTMPGAFKAGRDWLFPADRLDKVSFTKKSYHLAFKAPTDEEWAAMIADIDREAYYSAWAVSQSFGVTLPTISRYIKSGRLAAIREDKGRRTGWKVKGGDAVDFFAVKFNKN